MLNSSDRYAARQAWLARNPGYQKKWKAANPGYRKANPPDYRSELCARARSRGRKRGLEATIKASDLHWPTHCPVLGIELDYPERSGERGSMIAQPNWPSLDRWDSTKGYVPGNVFVISYRANTLKNNATYEEIVKVAQYLRKRPA